MKSRFLLPTPIELIREIVFLLGIRTNNKKLDNLAPYAELHPVTLHQLIDEEIFEPLKKKSGHALADAVRESVIFFLDIYCKKIVPNFFVIGQSRTDALKALYTAVFPRQLFQACLRVQRTGKYLTFDKLLCADTALGMAFQWYEESTGIDLNLQCTKELQDQIRRWSAGTHIPSLTSLLALVPNDLKEKVFPVFIIARFIDQLKRQALGKVLVAEVLAFFRGRQEENAFNNFTRQYSRTFQHRFQVFTSAIDEFREILDSKEKTLNDKALARTLLIQLRELSGPQLPNNGEAILDLCEAKFLVMAGEIELAIEFYKASFDGLLFSGGRYLSGRLAEIIAVASLCSSENKIFLKRLKTVQLLFGINIESASFNASKTTPKFDDVIEQWEIDTWIHAFTSKYFPKEQLFPGVNYSAEARMPLYFENICDVKPDYQNPNRAVKVGSNKLHKMPQLLHFIRHSNYEVCKRLIDKGADINCASADGENALHFALEHMSPFKLDINPEVFSLNRIDKVMPYDRRFYDLVIKNLPIQNTINKVSISKRLNALVLAVRAGKIDVVQQLLNGGADVNLRGFADNQTPLSEALKQIGLLKNSDLLFQKMLNHPDTPQLRDFMRRKSFGHLGAELSDYDRVIQNMSSEMYRNLVQATWATIVANRKQHTSVAELRRIAQLLIQKGADVNAEHLSPVQGYTPLMLAAELDEADLFQLMCGYGGKPEKTFVNLCNRKSQNCWDIANDHKAAAVLDLKAKINVIVV